MIPIPDLASLASALSLPVCCPCHSRGSPGPHVIFRGPLMSFHHRLDECRVAHEVTVDPVTGYGIRIAGLVVERGELGGVLIRESASVQLGQFYPVGGPEAITTGPDRIDEHGRAILFGTTGAETERALWAARSVYRWAEESRSDYRGDVS